MIAKTLSAACALSLLSLAAAPFSERSPLLSPRAEAAEWTDVIDAADGDDPFDITAEVFYRRHLRRAKITREYNCDPANGVDVQTCPNAPAQGQLVNVKELRYQRWTHEMVPRLHLGLWKDLEFLIEMPVVIQDEQEVRYAGNGGDPNSEIITGDNSSVVPTEGQRLFNFPTGLPVRAGFGDMLFKLRFAPISHERDESRGEWVLEAGYRAPTGTAMERGNNGVGRGVHELELATSFSRRYRYLEPYSSFSFTQPFAATSRSVFQEYWGSQEHILPGIRARFDFGAEMIPYHNPRTGMKFLITLGLGAGYQAEGRDYSELFDALAIGATTCDPNNMNGRDNKLNCASYNPNAIPSGPANKPNAPSIFDGATTVEEFMTVRGHLGFAFHASHNIKFGTVASLAHETEHNITNAEIGRDLYNFATTGDIEQQGVLVPATTDRERSEHNPTYVQALDPIGRRLRVEETTVFTIAANLSVMF